MKNRGFTSLILVTLVSFSIWALLYSVMKKNESLFVIIRENREMQSARSAAIECKMRALESLTEDIHAKILGATYPTCSIDSLVTSVCTYEMCNSHEYGVIKDMIITGKGSFFGSIFRIKTRFILLNQPPFTPVHVYTERI